MGTPSKNLNIYHRNRYLLPKHTSRGDFNGNSSVYCIHLMEVAGRLQNNFCFFMNLTIIF